MLKQAFYRFILIHLFFLYTCYPAKTENPTFEDERPKEVATFHQEVGKNSKNNGVGTCSVSNTIHIADPYFQVPFLRDFHNQPNRESPVPSKILRLRRWTFLFVLYLKFFRQLFFKSRFSISNLCLMANILELRHSTFWVITKVESVR